MPTIMSHAAVPIAAAVALGSRRIPLSMLLAGMLAAVLPDFDAITFKLGIHYGGIWGHRGFTHTLGFALLMALAGCWLAKYWKCAPWKGYVWVAVCMFSHPLLDMFTNGGASIPLLWPFVDARYFSPWRPIEVSPVAISRFLTQRGADVLMSELKLIWLPLMSAALLVFAARRAKKI
jgi:inner membrane protein